jgi:PAS domain S-box-containing protein
MAVMRRIVNWPIQRKLLAIIFMTVAASLVLVMLGIFAYEVTTYRSRLSRQIDNLGGFIAANSAPTLAFDDAQTAQEILNTLKSSPEVAVAALYTPDARLFASYTRPGQSAVAIPAVPPRETLRAEPAGGRIELVRRISKKGRPLGTLCLIADQATLHQRLAHYAGIFAVLSFAIAAAAFLLRSLMQRLVSDPLLRLAATAEVIAGGELSLRFPVESEDEMGQLAGAFNHMTTQLARSYEVLKEREEQLRSSEATLRIAVEATGLGTFDFYPESSKLVCSELAREHFGLSREAPVDCRLILDRLHPQERDRVVEKLEKVLHSGSDGSYSDEFRTSVSVAGKERWLVARGQVFFDEAGEPVRFIVATLDISERKETETELRRAKDQLEVRVRERTSELERTYQELHRESEERLNAIQTLRNNEQLLLQQSRLAAMGEMLGNIAHQWRQPLNTLGLIVQELAIKFAMGGLREDEVKTAVAGAMELILHMSRTIDDFRGFLQQDKEKTEFSVNQAVSATISLLEATLKAMEVEVRVQERDQLLVLGHRNEFSQVIMNLITNSRDAFQEKGVTSRKLEIELFREGGKSVVTVTDNAGGIPETIIDRIFDPYFTTKGPDKGTGIGLFMSKTIIEKSMNGTLTVRNTGEGARFRIEI